MKTRPAEERLSEGMVLAPVALGTMLAPLNSTMIAVAIPSLLEDFGRPLAWGSWIVTPTWSPWPPSSHSAAPWGPPRPAEALPGLGLRFFSWRRLSPHSRGASRSCLSPGPYRQPRRRRHPKRHCTGTLAHSPERGRAFGNVGSAIAVAAGLVPQSAVS